MRGTHYFVLGVARDATSEELTRAYRKLAMRHHPDRGGDARRMVQLNDAYEVLSDEQQRRLYDLILESEEEVRFERTGQAPDPIRTPADRKPAQEPWVSSESVVPAESVPFKRRIRQIVRRTMTLAWKAADMVSALLFQIIGTDVLGWILLTVFMLAGLAGATQALSERIWQGG